MSLDMHTILPNHVTDIAACRAAKVMQQALFKHPITGTRIIAPANNPPKGWQRIVAGCDAMHSNLNPTEPTAA